MQPATSAARPLLALAVLALAACAPPPPLIAIEPVELVAGVIRVEIELAADAPADAVHVTLDGLEVNAASLRADRLAVEAEVRPGFHLLFAWVLDADGVAGFDALPFRTAAAAPSLVHSTPADGTLGALRSDWITLRYEGAVEQSTQESFALACDGVGLDFDLTVLEPQRIVVNPVGVLPAAADCHLAWPGRDGREQIRFSTAGAGPPVVALYDRSDAGATTPFPDDIWTLDPDTCERGAFVIPTPDREPDVVNLYAALQNDVSALDGFSPIAHLVIEFSDAIDPSSLPATPADSLDPLASAGLFDLDPQSETYARRIPFRMDVRDDTTGPTNRRSWTALVFPSRPLDPGGRYGFVVTRRAMADPSRPLDPSAATLAALRARVAREAPSVACARTVLQPLLEVIENEILPPIPRDDVALALRFTVRSLDGLPAEFLSLRRQIFAAPAPGFSLDEIASSQDPDSDIAAVVSGIWDAPEFRAGGNCAAPGPNFARDSSGEPLRVGSCPIAFTLALPMAAREGPVPVVIYQHGNPGSAEVEVPRQAAAGLAAAGFAVIGFTDLLNRELVGNAPGAESAIARQALATLTGLLSNRRLPDFWAQSNAEQLGLLRLIAALGETRILPSEDPQAPPELDLSRPLLYFGISQGANHAPGFLAYAPEVRAAVLVAGGGRLAEALLHQQATAFLDLLPVLFPSFTPADIWAALALFQTAYDRQDAHNHARFWLREPREVDGTFDRASALIVEGLDDSLVPNHATESLAWQLGGAPLLGSPRREIPFLQQRDGPLSGNIDARTTAALMQFVPVGVEGIEPTPGCLPPALPEQIAHEGHFCAQSAAEARRQREDFFSSALADPAPIIFDPFASH